MKDKKISTGQVAVIEGDTDEIVIVPEKAQNPRKEPKSDDSSIGDADSIADSISNSVISLFQTCFKVNILLIQTSGPYHLSMLFIRNWKIN